MERKTSHISSKQFAAMLFMAFISPAARLLPQRTAAAAGCAAWLAPVAAILPVLFTVWALSRVCGRGEAPVRCFFGAYGPRAGRIMGWVYAVWMTALAALCVRFYAERFLSASYEEVPMAAFAASLLGLVFIMLRKKPAIFARACCIYLYIIAGILAVLFALSVPDIKLKELTPLRTSDTAPVSMAALSVCASASIVTYAWFLRPFIDAKDSDRPVFTGIALSLTACSAIVLLTVGVFSAEVVQRAELPFFMLVKNIRVLRVLERCDSFVVAFFVLTDLSYCALMLFSAMEAVKRKPADPSASWLPAVFTAACFAGALAIPDELFAEKLSEKAAQPANLFLGFVFPLFTIALSLLKQRFAKEKIKN